MPSGRLPRRRSGSIMQTRRTEQAWLPIPNGWHRSAQGCEARATLGVNRSSAPTLKGLHRAARYRNAFNGRARAMNEDATLSGLSSLSMREPRVARASYAFSGVRPSSGAASCDSSNALEILCPAARSPVSAPEDGRTPLNAYRASQPWADRCNPFGIERSGLI